MKKLRKSSPQQKAAAIKRGKKRSDRLKATQAEKPLRKEKLRQARIQVVKQQEMAFDAKMRELFGQR